MTDVLLQDLITTVMISSCSLMAALGFIAGVLLASLLSY